MSEEKLDEAVLQLFEAWNAGDGDRLLRHMTRDCVVDWSNSIGPNRGVYRGPDEVKALYERFIDAWEAARWEAMELIEVDDERMISVNRISARGSGSGIETGATGAAIWTVRDGKISHVKMFQGKADALEAAGLSE